MNDELFDVGGRVVAITGARGLIGKVLVQSFLERGAKVAAADVIPPQQRGSDHRAAPELLEITCDVSESREVGGFLASTLKSFQRVDVLINAHQHKPAGFLDAQPETFPEELWDAIINVNLKGTFLTCREFGRKMLEQGQGSIINFGSTYGIVSSNPDLYEDNSLGNPLAYSASKAGIIMLTRYLGAYWAEKGVRVNCVTPHGVRDRHEEAFEERFRKKSPMRRLMTADEVIGAVLFLASDASSYSTGSNVLIEGGWTAW